MLLRTETIIDQAKEEIRYSRQDIEQMLHLDEWETVSYLDILELREMSFLFDEQALKGIAYIRTSICHYLFKYTDRFNKSHFSGVLESHPRYVTVSVRFMINVENNGELSNLTLEVI